MLNKVSQNREVNALQRWFLGQPRNELTGTAQAGLAAWEAECRRASESGVEEEEDTRRKRTGPGRGTLLSHPILSHGPKARPSILPLLSPSSVLLPPCWQQVSSVMGTRGRCRTAESIFPSLVPRGHVCYQLDTLHPAGCVCRNALISHF